ncbi:MAG: glycosyltransferase family 87 protein [Thermoanaerobaculia bacterium]
MGRRPLVLLVFAVALAFAAAPLLSGRQTDFTAYVEAARALRAGKDPYLGVPPYLYPPLLAVLLVPLTFVPVKVAAWGWAVASAAALATAAFLVARESTRIARVLVLALLFAPFAATQWNLQANAFVLLLIVLARAALDEKHQIGGGVALGLSIALKPFALVAVLALLLVGRWRAALFAAGTALSSFLLVLPFLGMTGAAASAGHVTGILRSSWVETYGGNISFNGTIDRLASAGAGVSRHRSVAAAIMGWSLALVVASAWNARRRGKALRPSAVIDLILAATFLSASSSWLHHSTVLFPAVAVLPPFVQAGVALLYAAASTWRLAPPGEAAALASLAGTVALIVVWLFAGRRAAEPC